MKKNIELIKWLLLPIYLICLYKLCVILDVPELIMGMIAMLVGCVYVGIQLSKI